MRSFILFLLISPALFSCQDQESKQLEKQETAAKDEEQNVTEIAIETKEDIQLDTFTYVTQDSLIATQLVLPKTEYAEFKPLTDSVTAFFKSKADKFIRSTYSFLQSHQPKDVLTSEYYVSFEFSYIGTDTISLTFSDYQFMTGNANGIADYYSFNYDVKNQTFLTLEDVCRIQQDADKEHIQEQLESLIGREWFNQPFDSLDVSLMRDSIHFNFGLYEAGPRVAGMVRIGFSKAEMKTIQSLSEER